MEPTIVAIGGGSLNDVEPDTQQIEEYILGLTGKERPRVCYIGTANGDDPVIILRFYSVFHAERCIPSHLNLYTRRVQDLEAFLLKQDVIYVGGGNTAALLAVWQQQGVDRIIREAWQRGIVLCGSSAGGICWHDAGVTDSFGLPLQPLNDCLGFIKGSFCPHYDVEVTRRPIYRECIAAGTLPDGIAADNCVGVHYSGSEVATVISSRREARAWRLERTRGGYSETEIVPRYLGA